MAKQEKQTTPGREPAKTGRPPEYKPEFCEQLVQHMAKGGSFKSFGAKVSVSEQTLHNWKNAYPEFLESKNTGETLSLDYYIKLGNLMATGQLRRLKSEEPVVVNGKVMYDNDGNVLMKREYEYTNGAQSVWIFMMKNMHKWRDRADFNLAGQPSEGDDAAPPINISFDGMTRERAIERMQELMSKATKKGK